MCIRQSTSYSAEPPQGVAQNRGSTPALFFTSTPITVERSIVINYLSTYHRLRENLPAPYRCFPTNWSRAQSMPAPYRRFPTNRISGEICRRPKEMNLCVSTNQTYGENMPAPYKRHFSGISGQLASQGALHSHLRSSE